MIRQILIYPDPRLKKICKPVEEINDKLRDLADDMLETMYKAAGIGLAAPQIGELIRVLVMDCEKDNISEKKSFIMFNPEIINSSEEINVYEEGCLSIPDQFAEISRPKEVEVRWIDRNGSEKVGIFDGIWATCVQHEIDHLNGRLFVDYIGAVKRQIITRKMKKLKRDLTRKSD